MNATLRVLVVDDSPFLCRLLASILESDQQLQVVGQAHSATQALQLLQSLNPDVLTLDLDLPGTKGLELLQQVMRERPLPVVLITGLGRESAAQTLQGLELGAVDYVCKFVPGVKMDPAQLRLEILAKVKTAGRIKVIRHLGVSLPSKVKPQERKLASARWYPVIVGSSTGGPLALQELLSKVPDTLPACFLVVQHIPAHFTAVLAAQMDRRLTWSVREAQLGDALEPGLVLVTPGDAHLLLDAQGRVELSHGPKIRGYRPCIDVTMQSAAQRFGQLTRGILLSGMGDDGTLGLSVIRQKGGRTYAQDEASCTINGMPQRAREQGVVDEVGNPTELAALLERDLSPVRESTLTY